MELFANDRGNGPQRGLHARTALREGDPPASLATSAPTYQPALSVLRVTAACGVAALHIISLGLKGAEYGTVAWWIADFYDAAVRWCVPVFVMISGALLLSPQGSWSVGQFYRRRLRRILVPLLFWSVFYLAWRACFEGLTWLTVAQGLVRGNPYGHLWYLYMIAGLYFVTPILQPFMSCRSRSEQIAIVVPLLVAVSAHSVISTLTAGSGKPTVFSRWVPFIPYYLCGSVLMRMTVPSSWLKYLAVGVVTAWLGVAVGTGLLFPHLGFYLSDYHCPLIILMSVGVFLLVSGLLGPRPADSGLSWKGWRFLDDRSFGIYLIHPVFMLLVIQLGWDSKYILPHPLVSIPVFSTLVILASLLATSLFKIVPGLRHTV